MSKSFRLSVIILVLITISVWAFNYLVLPKIFSNEINNHIITQKDETSRLVSLFYPNSKEAEKIGDPCNRDSILLVVRKIPLTKTPITDTIRLLIQGQITLTEKNEGFFTEFPNKDFKLLGANLANGLLTLKFSEVSGFTDGGSCRMVIMTGQIIKTAMQFREVKQVKFLPEEIFQP